MSKLYNMGCSFAYGNCVPERNKLCKEHKSPGTYVAKHLNLKEVNLARNGGSIDGVLRKLYTHTFDLGGVVLIGVPPAGRFQVVSTIEQRYNKERATKASIFGKNSTAQECIKYAYTLGPETRGDYFHTLKWPSTIDDDINETSSYYLHFSILKIQKRLQELGMKYYIYNSIGFDYKPKNEETNIIKNLIDYRYYYRPDYSLLDLIKSNSKYELAEGDQHPNHLAYEEWFKDFKNWLKEKI